MTTTVRPDWERQLTEDAEAEAVALRVLRGTIPLLPGETVADAAYKLAAVYRAHRTLTTRLREAQRTSDETMERVATVQGCTPQPERYDAKLTYGT